ncbi:MAG: hypothetical protein KA953_06075 [Lachnospiraceae bacterium]|nr:hypothetical protein [Lachnospiraceae bacterium]
MRNAPAKCPLCGERNGWIEVERQGKSSGIGRTIIARIIFRRRWKKREVYYCGRCGYRFEKKR